MDQYITDALAVAGDDTQVAAIFILVSIDPLEREAAVIEQAVQADLGLLSQTLLRGASGTGNFWRVDICYPNFATSKPECVAIDDAVSTVRSGT